MSDNNLKSKEDIQKMMALSEEINTLNIKVKQLVEDLSSTQDVLGSVQELAVQLTSKVGDFKNATNSYVPPSYSTEDSMGTPSYESAGVTRERIVPTPDNIDDYTPEKYTARPVANSSEATTTTTGRRGGGITDKQTITRETKATQAKRAASKKSNKSRPPKKGWGIGVGKGK